MKKRGIYLFLMIVVACGYNGSVFGNTLLEKEKAQEKIEILMKQIQKEEEAYKSDMQRSLSQAEKELFIEQHTQRRRELLKQLRRQRDIINESSMVTLLWNTAKIVGPIALAALAAYKIFAISSAEPVVPAEVFTTDTRPILPQILEEKIIPTIPTMLPKKTQPVVTVAQPSLPLIPEEIQKYRQASNAYGKIAVWFAVNALFDPFFYPYVAATFLGSVYYGVKGIQRN